MKKNNLCHCPNPYKIRHFGISESEKKLYSYIYCKWNKSFSLINGLGFAVLLLQKLNPPIFLYGETNRDNLILIILFLVLAIILSRNDNLKDIIWDFKL